MLFHVKVQFGSIIRIWKLPETKKFELLSTFSKEAFQIDDKTKFSIEFEDYEGDFITITNEEDLENIISINVEEIKKKSLKLLIKIEKGTEKKHENEKQVQQKIELLNESKLVVKRQAIDGELHYVKPVSKPQLIDEAPQSNQTKNRFKPPRIIKHDDNLKRKNYG